MSANFRGASDDDTTPIGALNDDAYEGAAEHPPGLKVSIGIGELVYGGFANAVQVATSTIGWLSLMIVGTGSALLSPGELAHTYGWKALAALTIAGGTQTMLHMFAQPMSSTFNRLRHIQHYNIKSTHAKSDVASYVTIKAFLGYVALGMDVISDGSFIHTILGDLGQPLIEALIIGVWMVVLSGSSTIVFYDGATRIWGAMEDAKDYWRYHHDNDDTSGAPGQGKGHKHAR